MFICTHWRHWQESLKSYWSYGYAEQACAKEYQKFMVDLRAGADCDLKVIGLVLSKIPAWKESLRPGQTSGLEDRVKWCLLEWLQKVSEEVDGDEKAESDTKKQQLQRLLDYTKQVPLALPKAAEEFKPWTEKLNVKVQGLEQESLQKKLDNSVQVLLQDQVTETSLEAFLNVMRETNGMNFKSVSQEDRLQFAEWKSCSLNLNV